MLTFSVCAGEWWRYLLFREFRFALSCDTIDGAVYPAAVKTLHVWDEMKQKMQEPLEGFVTRLKIVVVFSICQILSVFGNSAFSIYAN